MSSSPVEYSIAAPSLGRDPYRDRRPPYSEDAEQAVLAAMLMDADAVAHVVELLDDGMFYREGHRRIFRAMITLNENFGFRKVRTTRGYYSDPVESAVVMERLL